MPAMLKEKTGGREMEEEKVRKEQMEIAQMRFGMIAPVIQGTYPDTSVSAFIKAAAWMRCFQKPGVTKGQAV